MKGKIFALFLSFSIILCLGVGIAYYNTRAYGFDEDIKVISGDDEKITILDYDIYYSDIDNIVKKAKRLVPNQHNTMIITNI